VIKVDEMNILLDGSISTIHCFKHDRNEMASIEEQLWNHEICVVTKILGVGEEGLEEILEQVIRKKICAGRYRCKWHPDVIWYVPAGQMPSSGMTLCPFS
jgi:hypothetical protein